MAVPPKGGSGADDAGGKLGGAVPLEPDAWPGRRDVELVAEPTATITAENMSRSLPLLRARGVEEALVVCDPLHLLRVRYFFASYRRYGIRVRYALTPLRPSLRALAWEAGAIPLMRRQRRRALAELGGEQP